MLSPATTHMAGIDIKRHAYRPPVGIFSPSGRLKTLRLAPTHNNVHIRVAVDDDGLVQRDEYGDIHVEIMPASARRGWKLAKTAYEEIGRTDLYREFRKHLDASFPRRGPQRTKENWPTRLYPPEMRARLEGRVVAGMHQPFEMPDLQGPEEGDLQQQIAELE